jgi:hypothetical protein
MAGRGRDFSSYLERIVQKAGLEFTTREGPDDWERFRQELEARGIWHEEKEVELRAAFDVMQDMQLKKLSEVESTLLELQERRVRLWSVVALIATGLVSILTVLISGYSSFLQSLKELLRDARVTELFVGPAMAAATGAGSGVSIGPVFVYGVYVLFSVAYLGTLIGIFFGKLPKDRANAFEVFKTLNDFFIGAVSGTLL